ncbi:hypothetical protein KR074_004437, partial [Drosophila pseudoananassae]
EKRFNSRRLIFQAHVNDILGLTLVEGDSITGLRGLSDKFNAHMRTLKNLGSTNEIAGCIIVQVLLQRLDPATQVKWEESLNSSSSDAIPTWESLAEFLEQRCRTLEAMDANYPKALAALNRVYDNQCLIFFDCISRLFDIPSMQGPSALSLRHMIDTVTAIYESLLSLGSDKVIANAMLIHIVMTKVDAKTKSKWEESLDFQNIPLWQDCQDALNKRYQHLAADEATSSTQRSRKPGRPNSLKNFSKTSLSVANTTRTQDPKCYYCKAVDHYIHACSSFVAATVATRFKFAKTFPLCINCLRKGHSVLSCQSSKCRVCSKPHHSLLHRYSSVSSPSELASTQEPI